MTRTVVVVVALCVSLAACGGGEVEHEYDETAHYRAVVAANDGHAPADWPTVRELWKEFCGYDEDRFALQMAVAADAGDRVGARLGVEHVCPDRLGEFDAATGR